MSVQVMLFSAAAFLFMLLLMCCGSSGVVCAGEVEPGSQSNSLELFKNGETMVSESRKKVTFFRAHSLVDVNGLMVAFAEANSNCTELCCIAGLLSKSLKYEKDKLPSEVIKPKDGNQWMAQAVATRNDRCAGLFGPSAVVKDNKIYILVSMIVGLRISNFSSAFLKELELVVGTVETSTDGSPNRITWQPSKSLKDTLQNKMPFRSSREDLFALVGRGIVMGDGTIVFPLGFHNLYDEKVKCTVIYSEDNGGTWNFPPGEIIDKDCERPTLLELEGKLLMIPNLSSSSRTRKVHVSADKGKTWTEDGETGSSLLVDFLIRAMSGVENGMTTATINGKNLTLLSQPVISSRSGAHNQVHLFMTDNRRITSVGPISLDKETYSGCKLLHKEENGGLFALCDKGSRYSPKNTFLFSLTEQLERIKSVLKTWEITDEKVSKICISATKEACCSTPMPTTGLIGFLSNTGDETHWADEYLGVNATVTGGAKVENGFKLSGSCAKVEWRFGGQEQNQLYSFADRGLTLVATVTINDIPESDTLLMTVGLTSKTVGLWYGKDGEWKGLRDGKENTSWEKDKQYQVVITVMNGAGSVYIDGKRLGSLEPNFRSDKDGKARRRRGVSHELKEEVRLICFGGCVSVHDGDGINAGSSFTVTNVFLYNRVLNATELLLTPPPPEQQQQQDQSQSTAEETGEATTTGNSTDEEQTDKPPQQEQEQSQCTGEETGEATTTGNSTDEEQTDKPPQQEQEQSQCTGEETGEATTTGNSTDEGPTDTAPAGNDSSVHESLSSLFQLFSLLVFLGSATL